MIAEQEQRQKDYSFTDFSNQLLSLLQCASLLLMCMYKLPAANLVALVQMLNLKEFFYLRSLGSHVTWGGDRRQWFGIYSIFSHSKTV